MRINLNIEKSIERNWVINKNQDIDTKFNKLGNILFKTIFVGFLIGFPIFLWVGIYTKEIKSFSTVVFPGVMFAFGLVCLYGSLVGNKFIRFRAGHDINQNRELILKLLKEYFPKNNFYNGESFMTSYLKPKGFMKRKKATNRILIIFDRNDVLMNISVISDAGIQSPFHQIFHQWTINKIKNRLARALDQQKDSF